MKRSDDFIRFPTTHIEIQTTINNFEISMVFLKLLELLMGAK